MAVTYTMPTDVMMPSEWYSYEMQSELFAAGIKYPVYANKELEDKLDLSLPTSAFAKGIVYLPHFGNFSMRNLHQATGGNPLTKEERSRMCLVITQPIEGLSYSRAFHGNPQYDNEGDEFPAVIIPGQLSRNFRENAIIVQRQAMMALRRMTDQHFEVMGCKLSPLSSNRANIVMYVRFEHECPFERQFYEALKPAELRLQQRRGYQVSENVGSKVRIVPRPIISDEEYIPCAKLEIQFAFVDNGLFEHAYNYVQHLVEDKMGMHLRHIRLQRNEHKLQAVAQFGDMTVPADFDKQVAELQRYTKNPTFQPYLATGSVKHEIIYLDNN